MPSPLKEKIYHVCIASSSGILIPFPLQMWFIWHQITGLTTYITGEEVMRKDREGTVYSVYIDTYSKGKYVQVTQDFLVAPGHVALLVFTSLLFHSPLLFVYVSPDHDPLRDQVTQTFCQNMSKTWRMEDREAVTAWGWHFYNLKM